MGDEVGQGGGAQLDLRALVRSLDCFLRAVGSHCVLSRWVAWSHGRARVLTRCLLEQAGAGRSLREAGKQGGERRVRMFLPHLVP